MMLATRSPTLPHHCTTEVSAALKNGAGIAASHSLAGIVPKTAVQQRRDEATPNAAK